MQPISNPHHIRSRTSSMYQHQNLRILIIGSGGRESVLAWKLIRSPRADKVFVVPGNAGTAQMLGVTNIESVKEDDFSGLVKLAQDLGADLCVPGPERAIVEGIAGFFQEANIPCFAPSREAALLEGSKAYAKDFMKKYNIPTAEYRTFTNCEEAYQYLESTKHRVVIKASGLTAGQGLVLPETLENGLEALKTIMTEGLFGTEGDQIIIEEFLEGEEVSIMAFSDGITLKCLQPVHNYKRIFDDDKRANTRGMGAYAPVRLDRTTLQEINYRILSPTFEGLKKEESTGGLLIGTPLVGMLLFGIMLTKDGPKALEYDTRFGDPEAQALLPLISDTADFVDILIACVDGRLNELPITMDDKSSVVVVCSSEGYPGECLLGDEITIEDRQITADSKGKLNFFHIGTRLLGSGRVVTLGRRVIAVSATAETLEEAVKLAYEGVSRISFEGIFYRRDIGKRALPLKPSLDINDSAEG